MMAHRDKGIAFHREGPMEAKDLDLGHSGPNSWNKENITW